MLWHAVMGSWDNRCVDCGSVWWCRAWRCSCSRQLQDSFGFVANSVALTVICLSP